jgi:hypothetical protein
MFYTVHTRRIIRLLSYLHTHGGKMKLLTQLVKFSIINHQKLLVRSVLRLCLLGYDALIVKSHYSVVT